MFGELLISIAAIYLDHYKRNKPHKYFNFLISRGDKEKKFLIYWGIETK